MSTAQSGSFFHNNLVCAKPERYGPFSVNEKLSEDLIVQVCGVP